MSLRSLLLLASLVPAGLHLQTNDISIQPPEAQIYRPVLEPAEASPPTGTYVLNRAGKPCIKATMGVEYIVIEKKKTWYFNLDPPRVQTSGDCGDQEARLSLTLPNNTANLQFTFKKEKNFFYVTKVTGHVSPLPVCPGCPNETYSGLVDHEELFRTADGQSFTCKSENLLLMSSELQVKLVPLQVQAFTFPKGQYGKESECWTDFSKRIAFITLGAAGVGVILIAVLTYLLIKDRRRQGYERI